MKPKPTITEAERHELRKRAAECLTHSILHDNATELIHIDPAHLLDLLDCADREVDLRDEFREALDGHMKGRTMSNERRGRPPSPADWSKQMTRREWTETWVRWAERPGGIPRYVAVAAEIRALWKVVDMLDDRDSDMADYERVMSAYHKGDSDGT